MKRKDSLTSIHPISSAGNWLFMGLRWRDPDHPDDLAALYSDLDRLREDFSTAAASFTTARVEAALRGVVLRWRTRQGANFDRPLAASPPPFYDAVLELFESVPTSSAIGENDDLNRAEVPRISKALDGGGTLMESNPLRAEVILWSCIMILYLNIHQVCNKQIDISS